MKNLIALTMAVLMMSAMAVSAFADVDPSYAGLDNDATANPGVMNAPGTRATPSTFASPALSLGVDADGLALADALLTPGKEYRFPLLVDGAAVTETTLDSYNVRFTAKKGSSTISSISLVKYSGEYNVVINTKTAWPTTSTEVQYEIRLVSRSSGSTEDTLTVSFETGYQTADDAVINSLSMGDEIIVDNDRPVYTKSQLDRIASVNNYRNVTFVGSNWRYTTNVADMNAINLLFNHNGITDLLGTYPNHDFEFINFPSGPSFSINGRFEVDVYDFAEDFDNFYVYRYLSGNLTELTSNYDEEESSLTFNTNTLGRFVISDRPMETTAAEEPVPETPNEPNAPTAPGNEDDKYNPGTGAVA